MSSTSPINPKRERSPTPPLTLTPRTSGVKRVAPLPPACKKSSPNYQQARKQWLREEVKALNALGLTVTKMLIRDDGLSLEWESPVPVWPDTLKPANLPSSLPSADIPMQNAPDVPQSEQGDEIERQARELEDLAIEFLKKYVQTFDTNRSALRGAYASDALFSYSIHEHSSVPRNSVAAAFTKPNAAAVHRFAPRKGAHNLLRPHTSGNIHSGPSEITNALLSFGPHKFSARSPTELRWNVLALHMSTRIPVVFLSSHGDLTELGENASSGSEREKRLSFDQCFLLQRPQTRGDQIDRDLEWPLVAVSHQLTVRDLSLRPLTL